jgi:hypothetical protein
VLGVYWTWFRGRSGLFEERVVRHRRSESGAAAGEPLLQPLAQGQGRLRDAIQHLGGLAPFVFGQSLVRQPMVVEETRRQSNQIETFCTCLIPGRPRKFILDKCT